MDDDGRMAWWEIALFVVAWALALVTLGAYVWEVLGGATTLDRRERHGGS